MTPYGETGTKHTSSQADDLDDSPEKQQACLDALAEKMKAYQDAASMIKKKVVPWCNFASDVLPYSLLIYYNP